MRLPLLSRYELSSCVRKFRGSVSKGCQTKDDCINLIESDFMLQTNQLMRLSTPDLLRSLAVSPSIGESSPRLSLICRFIHNRYGTVIASQLLCLPTRWNPPEMTESGTPQPAWLNTPVTQLRLRFTRVDAGTVKKYCVGGFDISNRVCPISFAKQASYCLDLADRSFRYHHSFMFVVLNIIQRRTAHLQT